MFIEQNLIQSSRTILYSALIPDQIDTQHSNERRVLSIATRSDGYVFLLVQDKYGDVWVKAGCRYRPLKDYRAATQHYSGRFKRSKAKETLAILDLFALQIKARWNHQ